MLIIALTTPVTSLLCHVSAFVFVIHFNSCVLEMVYFPQEKNNCLKPINIVHLDIFANVLISLTLRKTQFN